MTFELQHPGTTPESKSMPQAAHQRLAILDGWRALSILAVLAGHWLPLGPSSWQMNAAVAASGMALFFCLSGFLITHFLLADQRIFPFFVKRISRILPLAWLAMAILVIITRADPDAALANLLFVSNLPPDNLLRGGHHLWSLCVEVQFYVLAGLTAGLLGRRGIYLFPLLCLAVTANRMVDGVIISIVTWHRLDEILIGSMVALVWHHRGHAAAALPAWAAWLPIFAFGLLLVAANPLSGAMGYARPYLAGLAIGASLFAFPALLLPVFVSGPARYIAQISYALYVYHGMLTDTVLGGADASSKAARYALRIPLAAATWLLAHLSTFHFERFFTDRASNFLLRRYQRMQ